MTWRKLLIISGALIFPGAIVAGELDVLKSLFFILIPLVSALSIYYLKTKIFDSIDFSWRKILSYPVWSVSLFLLATFLAVYFNQFSWTILTLFMGVWVLFKNPKWGVLLLTFVLLIFNFKFGSNHFSVLAILISCVYFLNIYFKSRKLGFDFIVPLVAIIYFSVFNHNFFQIGLIIAILLFCFLLEFKAIFSFIFAICVLIVSTLFFKVDGFLPYAFLAVSLVVFLKKFLPRVNILAMQLVLLVSILVVQFAISNQLFQGYDQREKSIDLKTFSKEYANNQVQNSVLKEGRFLEYIENTLVAPHSSAQTIGTGAQTLGEYLKLMVFPYELSFYYGFAKTSTVGLQNPWVWLSIISHLLLVILAFWQIKKRPIIAVGIAWYLLCILLFSNWIELVAGMVGERLVFTASAGFCIFSAATIFWLTPSFSFKKPSWIEFVVGAIVILFLVKTVSRNAQWQNHITLMENDLNHLSNSAQANNLYASNLMKYAANDASLSDQESLEYQQLAAQHFKKSVEIYPYFFNTQFDKARASVSIGDTISAIEGYQKAIQLDSTFSDSYFYLLNIFKLQKDQKSYLQTARLLGSNFHSFSIQSEQQKAIEILKDTNNVVASFVKEKLVSKSWENNPLDTEAYFDLLNVYAQQNNGIAYLSTAKKLAKIYNKSDLFEALAKGYFMTNQIDSAILILNQGIALHPNVQSLKDNLREVEKFR
jgi:tetratricopeptide (TPR) repeat protein